MKTSTCCALLLALACWSCITVVARADPLDELVVAWGSRSVRLKSLQATLEVDRDHRSRFSRPRNEWVPYGPDEVPETAELVIRGGQLRYEGTAWSYDQHTLGMPPYDHEKYEGDAAELRDGLSSQRFQRALNARFDRDDYERREPERFVSVFDGEQRLNFWAGNGNQFPRVSRLRPPEQRPHGDVYFQADQLGGIDLDALLYQPLILHVLPFEPAFGGLIRSLCSVEPQQVVIRGRKCWVVHEESQTRTEVFHRWFFVDPECDWTTLRYIGAAGARPQVQMDMEIRQIGDLGWTPCAWTVIRIDATDRPIQNFARVTADVRPGPTSGELDVAIRPPTGTWWTDWSEEGQHLVLKNGKQRRIIEIESDARAEYEDLMNSETGASHAAALRRTQPQRASLVSQFELWDAALIALGILCCCTAAVPRGGLSMLHIRNRVPLITSRPDDRLPDVTRD